MLKSHVKKIPMQTRSTLQLDEHLGGATVTIQGYGSMTMAFEPTPNPPLLAIRLLEVDLAWEPFELPLPGNQCIRVERLRVRTEAFDLSASGGEVNPETGELALKFVITLSPINIPHMAHLGIAEPVTVVAIEKGHMNFATGHLIETHAEPFVLPFATVYAGQFDWIEVPGNGITNVSLSAVFNGTNLYLFMKGLDQKIYMNVKPTGEDNWAGWSEVPGNGQTDTAPSVVAVPDGGPGMNLFAKGIQDQAVYINTTKDGVTWSGWSRDPGGGITDAALTGAYFSGHVYLFRKGLDQKVYFEFLL